MSRVLIILSLLVPFLEIYVLIKAGGIMGAIPTISLLVFSAVLGALLLRFQGFSTLQRVRTTLRRGEIPAIEMFEGVVLLIAGVLFLIPGFVTDVLGFLCLIPGLRRRLIHWGIQHQIVTQASSVIPEQGQRQGPRIIEGEAWRIDDHNKDR